MLCVECCAMCDVALEACTIARETVFCYWHAN